MGLHQVHHLAMRGVRQVQVQDRDEEVIGPGLQQGIGGGQGLGVVTVYAVDGFDLALEQRGDRPAVLDQEHSAARSPCEGIFPVNVLGS